MYVCVCVCVYTEKKWTICTIWTRHCKSDEEGRALVCLVTFTCSVDRALSASIYVTLYTAHSPLSIRRNTDFYQLLRHEPITWKTLSSPLISRLFPSIPLRILFVHRFLSLQPLPCPRFRFISHTDTPRHRQASRQITSLRSRNNFDRLIARIETCSLGINTFARIDVYFDNTYSRLANLFFPSIYDSSYR